jgi:hypothetical protein
MDEAYRNAIGTVESSNNYGALGPETASGDRAYGRYQVMGNNIPDWTEKHLGTRMTPQEFLANKDAQDKVFDAETSAHFKKYGNLDDVTSTWFSGRPMARAGNASDGYNTVPQYVSKVNAAMDGPTAIDQAMGRRSTGSQAMAYADPGALNQTQPQGALTAGGSPVAAPTPQWAQIMQALGQTFQDMAPGIAQDPDHAKALESVASNGRKVAQQGTWSTNYDPRTGMATQTNSLNPTLTRQFKYAEPKPEKDPVQQAHDIKVATDNQDYATELAKNGAASRAALDTVIPIQAALSNPNVPQGTAGELLAQKNKALLNVPGFDTPELRKTVADTDVAVSGINKMVQEGRTLNGGMPGSLSDKDIVFLKQSQAGLGNTPEANQRILDIYKQLHQRRIELDNASQSYQADTGAHPLGLDNAFKKQLADKWATENAARDKALAAREAAGPATPAAPTAKQLPKGVKSIQLIQ